MSKTEAEVEIVYNKMFRRYYSPSNAIFNSDTKWTKEMAPHKMVEVKKRLGELIETGHEVKAGWAATSVRGFHEYLIFYKKRSIIST